MLHVEITSRQIEVDDAMKKLLDGNVIESDTYNSKVKENFENNNAETVTP